MADDAAAKTSEPDGSEAEEGTKGGKAPIFVMLGGLAIGAVAGVFVVGPMVAGVPSSDIPADAESGGHGESAGHGAGDVGSSSSHLVQGLIVNPAGTSGTRLLLISVAIQVDSDDTVTELEDRDAEVRDALVSALAEKTVEQLTDTTARDALKAELLEAVRALGFQGALFQLHIPQFVVQ